MSRMSELDIEYMNIVEGLIDEIMVALRSAIYLEEKYHSDGFRESSEKVFEQVVLPMHQTIDYLRNGNEVDYV